MVFDFKKFSYVLDRLDVNFMVKVADFGLSRHLFPKNYYVMSNKGAPVPVRWMAPESLSSEKFVLNSDVVCDVRLMKLCTRSTCSVSHSHLRSMIRIF